MNITAEDTAALERLIAIAKSDTGQSRRCADFLLAWWNAETCGGFDLVDLWGVDTRIATDMLRVFALIAKTHSYPQHGQLDYTADFHEIIEQWRPHLLTGAAPPH